MAAVLLAARFVLAAVFATAGIAKLADLTGSRRAVSEFGVPGRWVAPVAVLLPVVELGVAASLVTSAPERSGAAAGFVLLTAFAGAMAFQLLRGRTPDCHCFGRVRSRPASWRAVALNLVLAGTAVAVLVGGEGKSMSTPAELAVGGLILLGAIGLTARAGSGPQGASRGLPVGSQAPEFRLRGLDGQIVTLASLRAGGVPLLLMFSEVGCGPCETLASGVPAWQSRYRGELTIAVMECGPNGPLESEPYGRSNVLVDEDCEVGHLYGAVGTPTAVLVASDGRIASSVVAGPEAIEALLRNQAFTPQA